MKYEVKLGMKTFKKQRQVVCEEETKRDCTQTKETYDVMQDKAENRVFVLLRLRRMGL
jgi:hypothetical protein